MAIIIRSDNSKISSYINSRRLLLTGALLMLISLPFMHNQIPVAEEISILFILLLSIISGITQIEEGWISIVDTFVSGASFIFFAYYTVQLFLQGVLDIFFWINNALGIIFLLSLYFSIQSFVAIYFKKGNKYAI